MSSIDVGSETMSLPNSEVLLDESQKVLVQDWFKDSQSKQRVQSAVEDVLNANSPESYDRIVFKDKCDNVFDLMLNYAIQGIKWAV